LQAIDPTLLNAEDRALMAELQAAVSRAPRGTAANRVAPRISLPIVLQLRFRDGSEAFEALSSNLGEGGMFLRTDRECEVGGRFKMAFSLPGLPDTFETQAEVVWRRRPPLDAGLGVRFLDLTEAQRRKISAFVLDRWSREAHSVLVALPPEALRNDLRDLLAAEGLEVLCADDGKTALAHLNSLGGLGAVILETSLPGTVELRVLRDLRARQSILAGEVPIVLLLRKGISPVEVDRLRKDGASAVLGWGEAGDPARVVAAVLQLMGGRAGPRPSRPTAG